jgi:hypothetical protein
MTRCITCAVAVPYLPGQNHRIILGILRGLNPTWNIQDFRTYCGDCYRNAQKAKG